ncbi:MFS transporter [Streptomyces sp. NPDC127038]|uniref:MFS transporter n=1 Tax=Streptomyces sp. NPDC127038 TaxID=3347114 RepID=UPI003660721C
MTLVGTGMVLTDAAETALVAAAVPDELRGDFNGLVLTANESMKLLAPLAGAGLFTAFGGPTVGLLDAATFVLAATAFRLIRVREAPPTARIRRAWTRETAEGARYLRRHPVLRPLVATSATAMMPLASAARPRTRCSTPGSTGPRPSRACSPRCRASGRSAAG